MSTATDTKTSQNMVSKAIFSKMHFQPVKN